MKVPPIETVKGTPGGGRRTSLGRARCGKKRKSKKRNRLSGKESAPETQNDLVGVFEPPAQSIKKKKEKKQLDEKRGEYRKRKASNEIRFPAGVHQKRGSGARIGRKKK